MGGCASTRRASRYAGAAAAASSGEVPLQAVTSGLFTSGQPAPYQWASIRSSGVTTVINLRLDEEMAGRDEASEVVSPGIATTRLNPACAWMNPSPVKTIT